MTGMLAQAGATGTSKASMADKDTFMALMVAQLRYQDPSNPTDSAQFLAQTAQFTALEKMEAVAKQTQQLVTASMAFGASSLVGKTVSYPNADGSQSSGPVSAVTFGTDGPVLSVNGTNVPLSSVQSVKAAASGATSSTSA